MNLSCGLRRLWRTPQLLFHILLGCLLAAFLFGGKPGSQPVADAVAAWWHRRLCRILGLRLRRRGRPDERPALWVANHVSWLDIPVMGGWMPMDFVAKSEVRHWPVVGWLCHRVGTLFLERGSRRAGAVAVERLTLRLRRGRRVAVFPEGTTTLGDGMGRFHVALFQAALWGERPVQPVTLRYWRGDQPFNRSAAYIDDDGFICHLWNLLGDPRTTVDVIFGELIETSGRSRRELALFSEAAVSAQLATEVSPPLVVPPVRAAAS